MTTQLNTKTLWLVYFGRSSRIFGLSLSFHRSFFLRRSSQQRHWWISAEASSSIARSVLITSPLPPRSASWPPLFHPPPLSHPSHPSLSSFSPVHLYLHGWCLTDENKRLRGQRCVVSPLRTRQRFNDSSLTYNLLYVLRPDPAGSRFWISYQSNLKKGAQKVGITSTGPFRRSPHNPTAVSTSTSSCKHPEHEHHDQNQRPGGPTFDFVPRTWTQRSKERANTQCSGSGSDQFLPCHLNWSWLSCCWLPEMTFSSFSSTQTCLWWRELPLFSFSLHSVVLHLAWQRRAWL